MSIFPLPVFEADADPRHRTAMSDEEVYARLEVPKTIVIRFGAMKLVGEFPYEGTVKPGCGSKLVARTIRGTEIGEMLTTTCSNSGCGKSISRSEMRDYIENSGGKDYPFHQKGRILRVATVEDLNKQSSLESVRQEAVRFCKTQVAELGLRMKLVDVEPILGGEMMTFYYMSEDRIDFRELVQRLAAEFQTRIEMRQVAARDEARLVADYERCGQHCCCKNFLKVLKPVSMRAAKQQKATLDPLKISGRCGRLMCCLRYEDQTYRELKANLPPRNKRVGTSEGPGVVVDSKILVQLVLVRLEHDMKEIAVPVEELMDPDECPKPGEAKPQSTRWREAKEPADDPFRGLSEEEVKNRTDDKRRPRRDNRDGRDKDRDRDRSRRDRKRPDSGAPAAETAGASDAAGPVDGETPAFSGRTKEQRQDEFRERSIREEGGSEEAGGQEKGGEEGGGRKRKRRRRRRGGKSGEVQAGGSAGPEASSSSSSGGDHAGDHEEAQGDAGPASSGAADASSGDRSHRRKRRRRRGRRRDGGGGGGQADAGPSGSPGDSGT